MKELKASTKAGQTIIAKASYYEGYTLSDVYERPSQSKTEVYNKCYREYAETEDSHDFRICSHNTFQFSVSWRGRIGGMPILRYETANNSYLVWLDR